MKGSELADEVGFTLGICASDSAARLPALVTFLRSEDYGSFEMLKLVVIASGVPPRVVDRVAGAAGRDPAFELVVEERRNGKSAAVNRILERALGAYLVMLNADAFPERGVIRGLLEAAREDPSAGCVSAEPVFDVKSGMLGRSLDLMWSAHSRMSLSLNHAGVNNHACDELMVVRRSLLTRLPPRIVNDGAYIGGSVRRSGLSVKLRAGSRVRIEVPGRAVGLIRQRRRIIFGHAQAWRELGSPPTTVESMLFMKPGVSFRMLVSLLAARPELIPALPVVLVEEILASLAALLDTASSTDRHTVWRRVSG